MGAGVCIAGQRTPGQGWNAELIKFVGTGKVFEQPSTCSGVEKRAFKAHCHT